MLVGAVTDLEASHKTLRSYQAATPVCPTEGALLQLEGCGLCGSDIEKLGSDRPALNGTVLGHEVVGSLSQLGEAYTGPWKVGQRLVVAHHVPCLECVYCRNGSQSMCKQFKATNLNPGGFAEQIALSAAHLTHTAFPLPAALPLAEGICVEPLACVLKAIRRSQTSTDRPGSSLVLGLGFIGLLAMQAYQSKGWAVYGLERSQDRLDWINTQEIFSTAGRLRQTLESFAWPDDFVGVDTVFLTVVTPKTLQTAIHAVRDGGNIILFAAPHSHSPQLDLSPLYFREINLIASYSPALKDLQEAHRWVLDRRIALAPLVTHQVGLQDIDQGVTLARSAEAIKVLVTV